LSSPTYNGTYICTGVHSQHSTEGVPLLQQVKLCLVDYKTHL